MEERYTTPQVKQKVKIPKSIPKGSTAVKEFAKLHWYIEYRFDGKVIRVTQDLNRIKDPKTKENESLSILKSLKERLAKGFNPINPTEYLALVAKENITLDAAIKIFISYHEKHQSRKATIYTYKSKLNHLATAYPNKALSEITTKDLESFLIQKVANNDYSQKSISLAKRTFNTFFNIMIDEGYTTINPTTSINRKIKSFKEVEQVHIPYSNTEVKSIMEYLDLYDAYTAMFCRFIYFTCLRPSELKQLQVRDISIQNQTITIRANVKKVTKVIKDDVINIPTNFIPYLEKLNLSEYPENYYVLGSTKTIVGDKMIGKNLPYNRLIKCLKALKLDGKGKDLYSFKHTSNIAKWKAGNSIEAIMQANRHTNIQQTLTYLKNITHETDTKNIIIPTI
jgi:integrase